MEAKYEGTCTRCHLAINVGDEVARETEGGWHHEVCPEQSSADLHDDVERSDHAEHVETSTGGEGVSTTGMKDESAMSAEELIRSNLEREIKAAREVAARKLDALRRKEAKESAAIDAEVLVLLKTEHVDEYRGLVERAKVSLARKRAERSEKAKAARGQRAHGE